MSHTNGFRHAAYLALCLLPALAHAGGFAITERTAPAVWAAHGRARRRSPRMRARSSSIPPA